MFTNSQNKILFLYALLNAYYLYGVLSVSIQDIFPRLVRVVRHVIKSVELTQTKHRTAVSIVGVFDQYLDNNSYFNIILNNQWQLFLCQSLSVMSASHCTCGNAVYRCTHKPRQFWRCWCQWRYRSYLLATLAPADFRQWRHLVLPGSGCWSRFSSLFRSVWHYRNLSSLPSLGTQPGMAPILGSKKYLFGKILDQSQEGKNLTLGVFYST